MCYPFWFCCKWHCFLNFLFEIFTVSANTPDFGVFLMYPTTLLNLLLQIFLSVEKLCMYVYIYTNIIHITYIYICIYVCLYLYSGITDSTDMSLRQGSLTCYSPLGCKELDMTERLNWTELMSRDYLTSSFWIQMPFISIFCMISLARTSSIVENKW